MARLGFRLELDIAVAPAVLRDVLADLHAFSEFHPLIESVEALPSRADRPSARFYRVIDRIALGPCRFRTAYVAALETVSQFEVVGDAWQRPGVTLHTVYQLHPKNGGSRLVERVEVDALWGLRRFVVSQARRAHREMLARIKHALEAPLDSSARRSASRGSTP